MQCPANAKCVNSTHCTCLDGSQPHGNRFFTDTMETCDDIDECLGPSPPDCGPNTNCTNVTGNYSCSCIDGYESRAGKAKFPHASENSCQDIDECPKTPDICSPKIMCINTNGSYWCECWAGYMPSYGNRTVCQGGSCCRGHGGGI
ncbi:adhesion G protein-coupled receptor E5-like [Pangshura tecta]